MIVVFVILWKEKGNLVASNLFFWSVRYEFLLLSLKLPKDIRVKVSSWSLADGERPVVVVTSILCTLRHPLY